MPVTQRFPTQRRCLEWIVALLLFASPASALHTGQQATPDDNDDLDVEITGLVVVLDAAVLTGLTPVLGTAAEIVEYTTNIGLKLTPPVFDPPGPKFEEPEGCFFEFDLPQTKDSYEDWFGFWTIDRLATDWGALGTPTVRHANSAVVVSVSGSSLRTGDVELAEGVYNFNWYADTQFSPWLDVIIPPIIAATGTLAEAKYGDAIAAKIAKKNARVAKALKKKSVKFLLKVAAEAGLKAIDYGLDAAISDEITSATNSATQEFTVYDIHTPYVTTSVPDHSFEATDLGGTRFIRVEDALRATLDYGDDCGRTTYLSSNHPNILPLGTTEIVWTVTDFGVYKSGVPATSSISQFITVEDTQPPILVAPDSFVRLLAPTATSVAISATELGQPMVIDLADPVPAIENDAPGTYPADTRTAVEWTATDASGNADVKVQWITAKTSNEAPSVSNVQAGTRTAEVVDVRLEGLDMDVLATTYRGSTFDMVDPLGFEIVEYPDNGEFVAPLRPFFIEDFRLTPVGETEVDGVRTSPLGSLAEEFAGLPPDEHLAFMDENYCSVGVDPPRNMVYRPSYVHVTDDGIYYVKDSFFDCNYLGGGIGASERISKWSADRELLAQFALVDLNGGTGRDVIAVDEDKNVWFIVDEASFGGSQFSLHKLDENLGGLETKRFALSEDDFISLGRRYSHALGDPDNNLLYVHDNRGVQVFSFDEQELLGRLTIGGEEFFHQQYGCFQTLEDAHLRSYTHSMTLNAEGELLISEACEDRILKFTPSELTTTGEFRAGEFVGWMGRCSANIAPWAACNEETGASYGFACADDKCLREDGSAGDGEGQFSVPTHLNVDPNGNLYVADYRNARVQRFGPDGTFAGQARSEGTGINQGEAPGFVLGNMGNPQAVSVNSSSFYVMERDDTFGDYFLHIFETLPFHKVPAESNDVDGDGYEDNVTLVKYVSRFDFPGRLGVDSAVDEFRFIATDGLDGSNVGTASVTVTRNFRAPADATIRCYTDTTLADRVPCVVDEDTDIVVELVAKDPDGIVGFDGLDTLTYTVETTPQQGAWQFLSSTAAAAYYRYTPNPDYNGSDSLRYSVTDGIDTLESEDLEIVVAPVDDGPVFALAGAVAARGFPGAVHLTMTDIDAIEDEAIPHLITFAWSPGMNEFPGEVVENEDGTYSETGPVFNRIAPGRYQVVGRPVYPEAKSYDVVLSWQYNDDGVHDPSFHLETLGTVDVIEATHVTVEMELSNAEPGPGEAVTATLTIRNDQPEGWAGLIATDVEAVLRVSNGVTFGTVPASCAIASDREVRCPIGDLAPGATAARPIDVMVDPGSIPVPVHALVAEVSTTQTDVSMERMATAALFVNWPDADGDELPDLWEMLYGFDPDVADDAINRDSDGEGLNDFDEYIAASSPRAADTDEDGLDDATEVDVAGTDPSAADSDADGLPDGWEHENGLDPLVASDAANDADSDGLTNAEEFALGTNPQNGDSDGDGIGDLAEVEAGTDPTIADADNDGIPNDTDPDDDNDGITDVVEASSGLDSLDPTDALEDLDGDGFNNRAEFQAATAIADSADAPGPATGPQTLFASVLPGRRAGVVGQTVTAFATLINGGAAPANDCSLVPVRPIPATFFHRTTDPATNEVVGAVNESVSIAPGVAQSFVFGITPLAPLDAELELRFDCSDTEPVVSVAGLNTFGLTASAQATPDVIALAGTVSGDGTVVLDAASGAGAFAVATINVGAAGTVTATAHTGTGELPVAVAICRTDATTGACVEPAAPTVAVDVTMLANETQTFSVFVSATDTVPFDAAQNRLFVVFEEDGKARGATSVAVRTGD